MEERGNETTPLAVSSTVVFGARIVYLLRAERCDREVECVRGRVECEWESTEWSSTFDVVKIEKGSSNSNVRVATCNANEARVCHCEAYFTSD